MTSLPPLIPEPQSVRRRPGSFQWRPDLEVSFHPQAEREARRLAGWLKDSRGLELRLDADPKLPLLRIMVATRSAPAVPATSAPAHPEGYTLEVAEGHISVTAADQSGLFYGLQTLRQLGAGGQRMPAVKVDDWPGLALRGIHMNLNGCFPTFARLCEIAEFLAAYKMNTFVIEYEDKFPYERHPVLRSPEALTPDELREFLALCRDLHIRTVPLLQSLGHLEYVLRHEEYAHLREANGLAQLCPLHPGSFALVRDFMSEILAYHPDATYFHIGADECRDLGRCPRCQEVVSRQGKVALYLDYLNNSIRYVKSLGLIPIFWSDIIRNECVPRVMDLVEPGAVPCDWLYDVTLEEVPFVYWGGGERITSRRWLTLDPSQASTQNGQFIEDLPADQVRIMRRYWDRGRFPLWNDSLPLVRLLAERRAPFLGSAAVRGGTSPNRLFPEWSVVFGNVALWARRAMTEGALGVISTMWSRWNSLLNVGEAFEYGWHGILASADYYWHPRPADRVDFDRRFARVFLTLPDEIVPRSMAALENKGSARAAIELLTPLQGLGSRPVHLAHLLTAARVAAYQEEAAAFLSNLDSRIYQFEEASAPREERAALARTVDALLDRQAGLERELATTLTLTLRPADAEEVVKAQLRGLARRLQDYRRLLAAATDPA